MAIIPPPPAPGGQNFSGYPPPQGGGGAVGGYPPGSGYPHQQDAGGYQPSGYPHQQGGGIQPPPPSGPGYGQPSSDGYGDFPAPVPVQPTAQFSGIARSRHSGKIFVLQNIKKISSGQGKEEPRVIMLTSLFLLQLDKQDSPSIKRAVLLTEISHFEYDRNKHKVLMKVKSGCPERDWLFRLQTGGLPKEADMNLETIVQIINSCRAPLVDENAIPVNIINHIKSQPNIAKPPNYQSAKKRMKDFRDHPEKLPRPRQRRRQPPPQQSQFPPGFEPLNGPIRGFMVERADADEDLGFTYNIAEGFGVRIDTIKEGGAFHRAGIPPGHLHSMDGFPINGAEDMGRVIRERILQFPVELTPDPSKRPLPPWKPPAKESIYDQRSQSEGLTDDLSSEPADGEELLVNKLVKMCDLKRRGVIEEDTYEKAKNHICRKLLSEEDQMQGNQNTLEKKKPPAPYAVVNIGRYIYLRTNAERGAPWVGSGGVHGTLMAMHILGEWTFVKTHDSRQGYIRTQYLSFCQTPPEVSRKNRKKHWEQHLSDMLSQAESSVYGEEKMYDRYSQQPRGLAAPSNASSWGPSASHTASNWYDPELLYAANSNDVMFDENTWMTV